MVICDLCGDPSNSLGHVCRVIKEDVERESQVESDLHIIKNSVDTAVNRLVVWLTERALKEDSSR